MNRRMTVICATSLLGGCATFEDFDAARHPSINSVRGGAVSIDGRPVSANFNGLLEAIAKDRQLLLDKGKILDRSETAFGIAVLASAAYGGFNTTYGGPPPSPQPRLLASGALRRRADEATPITRLAPR